MNTTPFRSFFRLLKTCMLGSLLIFMPRLQATNLPEGGGLLDSGLVGSYYNNNAFTGEPTFVRRDLRIDFDWGSLQKPGGSLSWTKLGQLGADNYSVRWEGRIMARYSETYEIKAFADSVRIWIKPETEAEFSATPLIESWPASDPASYTALTAPYAFVAGEAYDIRIEYRERTGTAMMRLLWSSPSTPEEVIQPTAFVGEIPPQTGVIMADAVFASSNWGESNPTALRDGVLTLDANGWPMEDFNFIIRPQDVNLNPGTYLVTFKGKANVRIALATGAVMQSADGTVTYGNTSNGDQGYDPATNTTTLRAFVPAGNGNCWPTFTNTDRDGPGSAFGLHSGITDLRILKPVAEAGTEPHALDELFDRNALNTLETFVTFRWNDVNGNDDAAGASVGAWADRRQWGANARNTRFTSQNHEYKILLSNHSGRDLYIQVPHIATDDYVLQMARLIRYGGAANGTPYTSEQANPHFPPLNSNLRVVVEYSNETPWNTAGQYPQGGYVQNMPGVLRAAWLANPSSPDGLRFAAINFDGAMSTNPAVNINGIANGSRYFALRTVEISNIFRSVFGDEAMTAPGKHDPRVRTVMMYQYDNNNGTATNALNFIDRYFFKTDPASTFTGTARPVSWFLFGGGAATYYASADRYGLDAMNPLTAGGLGTFETPLLAPGEARVAPSGSPWTFSGTAGIYRQSAREAGVIGAIPAPTNTVDSFNYRGMKITVGAQDVAIYEIGRHVHAGNTASQSFAVYEADGTNAARLNTTWSPAGFPTGAVAWRRSGQNIFILSNKAYSWPVILGAGRSYYVVALESSAGSSHAVNVPITPPAGITIDGTASGQSLSGVWTWQVGSTPNRTHGPINIKVAPAPHATNTGLNLGFLNDSKDGMETITSFAERLFSPQAAFLAGTGSMEIEVTFPAPGIYGLIYHLAHKRDQTPWDGVADNFENRLMIHLLDGGVTQNITPSSQMDIRTSTNGWNHDGYWCKPNTGFDFYGSAPFEVTDASKTYRIRFSGTSTTTTRVVLIDNVHIASAAKMTEGQIPSGGGFAEGAPDVSNWEARVMSMYKYPQSFGIKAMSYEGGWYPGGDANKMPLQYASSFYAPSMLQGELNAMNALARAGLAVNTDYTFDFAMPDSGIRNPESFKRIQAWRQMNAGLAPEATNGQPLTSIFTSPSAWLSRNTSGATMSPGGWFSWNVIAAEAGLYDFRLETTGTGTVSVRVNDAIVALSGTAGGVRTSGSSVFLTKGLHTLRVLTQGGTASLVSLTVSKPGQPAGFNGISASPGNAEAFVRWNAQAGATGYHVYIKSRLDSTFTRFTTSPVTGTQLFVTGLQNNSTYNVVVTFINSSGVESAYSNQVSVVPSENPPMLAWEFDNSTTKTSGNLPATLQSGAVAGTVSIVVGPNLNLSTNSFVNEDAVGFGSPIASTFDANRYFGFSLAPAAGKTLRLTQLNMGIWYSGTNGNLRGELRVSTDNFSTHTLVPISPGFSTLTSGNMAPTTGRFVTADLSGIPSLQNLPAGTTASFRVHLWGSSINYAGIGKLGVTTDDIVLFGFPVDPSATEMPVASPGDGIYASPLSVTLSTPTTGAQIRYTLDGSNPTESTGTLIAGTSGSVLLNGSANLRAIAFAAGKTTSPVLSRQYTVAAITAAPQFSPPPGVYDAAQQVELSSITTRASIRYTLDGTDPTPTTGILYTGPIPLIEATTIKAIAYRSDLVPSAVVTGSYSFDLNSPGTLSLSQSAATVSETAGTFTVTVRRSGGAAGAASVAYATANGTAIAGQDYTAVSGTLNWASGDFANKTVTIPLINDADVEPNETFTFTLSNATGGSLGSPSVLTLTLTSDDTAPGTAAPVFTPAAGTYNGPVTVALSTPTAGATIRYTTNGTTPTATTGTVYSGPFLVSNTATVRAIAYRSGNADSAVVSAAYTVTSGTIPVGSFLQAGTGDIVMEAENFASQTANGDTKTWASATSITGFQGSSYITTTDTGASSPAWGSGTRTDYPVRFSSTGGGTYSIWVRSRSPSTNSNEAWLGVDGTRLGNANRRFSGGTFYNAYVWRRHGTTFTASNNQNRTIQLQRYEDGFIVDKILLTRNTNTSYITSNSLNPAESARQVAPVATPVALPVPGVYVGSVQVSLVSGTAGTSIRYTTNGTNPTSTTGTLYSGPFTLTSSATVRAIAYKTGNANSQVMSFTYTVEAGSVISFAQEEIVVNEADGFAELAVRRLGGAIGTVSVSYATSDGSAGAGQDYTATSGTLSWADGDTANKIISIPILNDSIFYENTESFSVTLSAPSSGATLGSPSVATVLIEDDDTNMPPTLTKIAPVGAVSIRTGLSLPLEFSAQDDGITGPLQFTWEHVEGPGTAVFSSATTPVTNVVFDEPGTHTLRLSAYDGEFTTTADLTVSTVLVINSPATTLYWGGGTTDLAEETSVVSRTGDATLMAGHWDSTLLNWNASLSATTGHRAWSDGNFAHFTFNAPAGSLTPDIELAQNIEVGGLTFELTHTDFNNAGFDLVSNDASTRILSVTPGAVLQVRTAVTSHVAGIRRAGHVAGRGGVTLAGSGGFVFEGLNATGGLRENAAIDIESGTITGPVEARSGRLRIGSFSAGATGLPNVTSFDIVGETILQVNYQAAADNRVGDSTPIRLAGGGLQLLTISTSLQVQETIASLTLNGSGLFVPYINQGSNTQLATLTLANGLSRGTNGKGTLVVANTNATGGLGVTGAGVRLVGHGLPSSTWLPWAFHFGRGELLGGGQTSVTAPGFLATDGSGELLVQPAIAGVAALDDTSWQAYDATSHVAIDNLAPTGALAEDVSLRSLGISLSGSSTFALGGNTLQTEALAFGDNSGRQLTFGTADASRGVLTVPEGVSELYIHHRRSNTSANSVLTLNAVISGAQDVIYSGTTAQIALAAANTYTGKTYINAHTLRLDGNVAPLAQSSEIYLAPSARLHISASNQIFGGGSVAQLLSGGGASRLGVNLFSTNRLVTLGANATLAPGLAGANAAFRVDLGTGKLILATGSKLALDLAAPDASDRLVFATAADWLAGSGQPTLELTLGAGFDYNEVYTLIENVTTSGLTFAAITGHNATTHTPVVSFQNNAYLLSFTPVGGMTPYQLWAANHPGLPDGENAPGDNPDDDAYSNLAEYAMGLDPMSADGVVMQLHSEPDGTDGWLLVMSVPRNPLASDVVWEVLRASAIPATPEGWTVDVGEVTVDYPAGRIRFSLPVPSPQTEAFLGLRLRLP